MAKDNTTGKMWFWVIIIGLAAFMLAVNMYFFDSDTGLPTDDPAWGAMIAFTCIGGAVYLAAIARRFMSTSGKDDVPTGWYMIVLLCIMIQTGFIVWEMDDDEEFGLVVANLFIMLILGGRIAVKLESADILKVFDTSAYDNAYASGQDFEKNNLMIEKSREKMRKEEDKRIAENQKQANKRAEMLADKREGAYQDSRPLPRIPARRSSQDPFKIPRGKRVMPQSSGMDLPDTQ